MGKSGNSEEEMREVLICFTNKRNLPIRPQSLQ